jgi:hypothetical protein
MSDLKQLPGCDVDTATERWQLAQLWWMIAAITLIIIVSIWVGKYLYGDTAFTFYRFLLLKVPMALIVIVLTLIVMCLADFTIPGEALKCVAQDPQATALLIGAALICCGLGFYAVLS